MLLKKTLDSVGYNKLMSVPPKVWPNNAAAGMKLESLGYTTLMGEPPKV